MKNAIKGSKTALPNLAPNTSEALSAFVRHISRDYAGEALLVILDGSQARGEAAPDSDIDLLIVVRHADSRIVKAISDLAWRVQFEHNVIISDIIRSREQFHEMQARRFPYIQNIEQEGIVLWKNTSEPTLSYA